MSIRPDQLDPGSDPSPHDVDLPLLYEVAGLRWSVFGDGDDITQLAMDAWRKLYFPDLHWDDAPDPRSHPAFRDFRRRVLDLVEELNDPRFRLTVAASGNRIQIDEDLHL